LYFFDIAISNETGTLAFSVIVQTKTQDSFLGAALVSF
jgi:hypothetical protein